MSVFACVALGFSAGLAGERAALAEEPGCTKQDLFRADNSAPERDIKSRMDAVFAEIRACKGKLSPTDEADAIDALLFYCSRRSFKRDVGLCRHIAENALHLDLDTVPRSASDHIVEALARCGGDCANVTAPKARKECDRHLALIAREQQAAAAAELKALNGKTAAEVEAEQPMSCDFRRSRKTVALLDRLAFRDRGTRFLERFRSRCGAKLSAEQKLALANDEALLSFHADDDAACLRALSSVAEPVTGTTAWNRALCGAACTLGPDKCKAAANARNKALSGRPAREMRREITKQLCWSCKPGAPCEPWRLKNGKPVRGVAVAWDLKSARDVEGGDIGKPFPLHWAGDLNGDGIGDFVTVHKEKNQAAHYLSGSMAWDPVVPNPTVTYKVFDVQIGCGTDNAFHNVWTQQTDEGRYYRTEEDQEVPAGLDEYQIRVDIKPNNELPSVCTYDSDDCDAKSCDHPVQCLDLGPWHVDGQRPGPSPERATSKP